MQMDVLEIRTQHSQSGRDLDLAVGSHLGLWPEPGAIQGDSLMCGAEAAVARFRTADGLPDAALWPLHLRPDSLQPAGSKTLGSHWDNPCEVPPGGLEQRGECCDSDPEYCLETGGTSSWARANSFMIVHLPTAEGVDAIAGAACRLAASDIGGNLEDEGGAVVTCPRQKLQEKNRRAQQRFRARQKAGPFSWDTGSCNDTTKLAQTLHPGPHHFCCH